MKSKKLKKDKLNYKRKLHNRHIKKLKEELLEEKEEIMAIQKQDVVLDGRAVLFMKAVESDFQKEAS